MSLLFTEVERTMIYTVTLNPSLDYVMELDLFEMGATNRSKSEHILPGGKGINVSIVLNNLGVDNVALGFIAGFTGKEIERRVSELGCKTDFISLKDGMSRVNVKLKGTEETEINAAGPCVNKAELKEFFEKIEKLNKGDILVLAGSIPSSVPDTIYRDIMETLHTKGVLVVADATKDLLLNVLEWKPFLIKPNHYELGEIFGKELKTKEELISYGKILLEKGARNVLISMAGDGAIFLGEDGSVLEMEAPDGNVVNSVGAGDSMVAGFLAGYLERKDYEYACKMGIAAGSASAFSRNLATKEEVEKVFGGME